MKAVGYGLAAALCLCAVWGAGHIGIIPGWANIAKPDIVATVASSPEKVRDLRHYLPILR